MKPLSPPKIARFTAAVAGLALLTATAACSNGDSTERSGASGGQRDPAKLTVWMMGQGSQAQTEFLDSVAAQYKTKHPGTTINVQYVPWPDFAKRFQSAIAAGEGPDVAEIGNDQVLPYAAQGAFADITAKVRAWPETKDLVPTSLRLGQQDGKTYAVPWYAGVRAVWYRKDLFAQHRITPPRTWTELEQAARTLKDKAGVDGIAAPSDFTNGIASFIWGGGGEIAAEEGGRWVSKLSTPESKAGIRFYTGLVTGGLAPARYVGHNELQGPQQDFALGKVGMYIDGSWAKEQLEKISKKHADDWGTFPIPGQSGMAPAFAGGSHVGVWSTSKAPEAAWDYITVLNGKQNAKRFADALGFFPQYTDLLAGYGGDPLRAGFATQMTNVKLVPVTPAWAEADQNKKIIPTMMKTIMQGGNLDQAVAKADKDLTDTLNQG